MKNLCALKNVIGLFLTLILFIGCNVNDQPAAPADTASEPTNLSLQKSGNCVKPPSGLVSWWPGDGDATDIVGNNHGTLQNGATFAPGMVGLAFSFDGVDDFVEVPDNNNLDLPGALTIDAWVNIRTTSSYNIILAKRNVGGDRNYQLTINPGGTVRFENSNGERDTDDVLTPGVWYHLAATHDGINMVKIYINGELSKTTTLAPAPVNNSTLRIGHDCDDCSFMNGLIDEVGLYNRELSQPEIEAIFNAGSAGKCRKVTICHKPGTPAQKTMVIPIQALAGHLGHGDTIGPCQ